ncbi:MAG TPA: PAS domain S-box protein [Candidatus Omnitrophota bacterium]|nr:PAS domain S-box protein [Candidatus Omnitrophota bacterium]
MQTIFFFYGLAFLIMGVTIFAMPKKNDLLNLSGDLWLVGLFALLHGLNEWVDLLILRSQPFPVMPLKILGALLLPASFVFLVLFGGRVLFPNSKFLKHIWVFGILGWIAALFLTRDFLISGIVARYFLCVPGTWMTALALLLVLFRSNQKMLPPAVLFGTWITAGAFFIYGILSGLVVPQAGFLLASFVNYPAFFDWTGFPVQLFRMVCALVLAGCFFSVTGIYFRPTDEDRIERRGGIRRKITLVVCLTSGFAVLLTMGVTFGWIYNLLLGAIEAKQIEVTGTLGYSISKMIDSKVQEMQIHIDSPVWHEAVKTANLRYVSMSPEAVQQELLKKDAAWIAAGIDDPLVSTCLATPMSLRLKILADTDLDVAEIFLTDRYGGVAAASNKTSDYYQADEEWWKRAYAGGKGSIFIGEVEIDRSTGILTIPVAIPIREGQEILGIGKEAIGIDIFFSALKSYKTGRTGHAALINEKGDIIFHEGLSPSGTKLFSEKEMQAVVAGKGGLLRRREELSGRPTFTSIKRLEDPLLLRNNIAWYVCVSQDVDEVFSPLNSLAVGMGLLLLIILLLAVLLGVVAGERFSSSIRQLVLVAEKIKAGQWDEQQIEIRTGDEIERFADTFSEMIRQIRDKQEALIAANREIDEFSKDLERKVGERTLELVRTQEGTLNILEDLTASKKDLENRKHELEAEVLERRRVQEELRGSKARLDLALQAASMGVWHFEIAEGKRYFDDQACHILGIDPSGFQGTTEEFFNVVHPDDREMLKRLFQETFETGVLYEPEYRVLRPGGMVRHITARGKLVRDETGKPLRVNGIVWDITESKQAQEALWTSRQMMKLVLDTVPIRVFWKDWYSTYLGCNQACAADLGLNSPEEIVGKTDFDLSWNSLANHYREDDKQVMERGVAKLNYEESAVKSDGRRFWTRTNKVPLRDEQGRVTGILGTYEDITAVREAEEKIRESEERFRTLVANLPSAVYRCKNDESWTMEFLSDEIFRISGYPASDFIHNRVRSYASIIHPEDQRITSDAVQRGIFEKKPYIVEYRILRADGVARWVYEKGQPIFDPRGNLLFLDGAILDITESREAAEKIRQLSRAVEQSPAAIVITNLQENIEYTNPKFSEVTGYSFEETLGKNPRILKSGEQSREAYEKLWATILAGKEWRGEFHNRKKNGELFWEAASISPIKDAQGRITHFIAIKEDITERKKALEELRESEERYRSYIEVTGQLGWVTSADGKVEDMPPWREFTGQKVEDVKGWGWLEAIHPEDREHTRRVWGQAVETKSPYETEYRIRRSDGVYRDFLARGVPISNADGSIREWVGTCVDITERKKIEAALGASRNFLDRIINSVGDPLFVKDRDHRWMLVNDAYCNFMGRKREELIGKTDHDFFPRSEADVFWQKDEEVFLSKGENVNEEKFTDSKGFTHTVITKKVLYVDEDRKEHIVGVIVDITGLKKIQDELLRSNKELEQFAYVASHDLQEPLRKISAFSRLLSEKDTRVLDEESKDYLERMQGAAARMSSLIDALLAYSRVATREKVLEHIPLKDVVEEVLSDLEMRVKEADAVVDVGPLPVVYADRTQMHQLFLNLIGNALKYRKKDVPVRVAVRSSALPGHFEITVEDNGIGFDEKYKDRIFAPFQRLHTREEYEGSGIGLSVCQKIVRQMGGEITARSEAGKGSVFIVTFPKV